MDYLAAVLQIANKLMDKIPDYDQRKKEKLFKLSKEYQEELVRPRDMQDDDLIANLQDEIKLFVTTFAKEIEND